MCGYMWYVRGPVLLTLLRCKRGGIVSNSVAEWMEQGWDKAVARSRWRHGREVPGRSPGNSGGSRQSPATYRTASIKIT